MSRRRITATRSCLTGIARISVNSGGNAMNFGVRFTDVWVNKGGNWQMVAWQSTKTPD